MDFFFSIIVPVYNRPAEVDELLDSLSKQTVKNFEVIIIEDGSQINCEQTVQKYQSSLNIKYFSKNNTGPGLSRNYGCEKAQGNYFIFLDSDCLLPVNYMTVVQSGLSQKYADAFGGPDKAHSKFTVLQKAINYAMTSFITTGGIRGKKKTFDRYQPRSFNMGFSRKVYETAGGFSDIHPGEDPDLSYRIMDAGFNITLIENAFVYHKRRIDFSKFIKQVYKFGVVRTILLKWHPDKFKLVYTFPSLFLIAAVTLILLSLSVSIVYLSPLLFLVVMLLIDSLIKTKNPMISAAAVLASFIQLFGYGFGFLNGIINIFIFNKHERRVFGSYFFDKTKQA